jgi:hypothetical protein
MQATLLKGCRSRVTQQFPKGNAPSSLFSENALTLKFSKGKAHLSTFLCQNHYEDGLSNSKTKRPADVPNNLKNEHRLNARSSGCLGLLNRKQSYFA